MHATEGLVVEALTLHEDGNCTVDDCVFRGIWNRSSVGQSPPQAEVKCSSGWTQSVSVGRYGRLTVSRSLFEDIDVAVLPRGALRFVHLESNTFTRANGNTIMMTRVGGTDWLIEKVR